MWTLLTCNGRLYLTNKELKDSYSIWIINGFSSNDRCFCIFDLLRSYGPKVTGPLPCRSIMTIAESNLKDFIVGIVPKSIQPEQKTRDWVDSILEKCKTDIEIEYLV